MTKQDSIKEKKRLELNAYHRWWYHQNKLNKNKRKKKPKPIHKKPKSNFRLCTCQKCRKEFLSAGVCRFCYDCLIQRQLQKQKK